MYFELIKSLTPFTFTYFLHFISKTNITYQVIFSISKYLFNFGLCFHEILPVSPNLKKLP